MSTTRLALVLLSLAGCTASGPDAQSATSQALTRAPGFRSLHLHWGTAGVELLQQRLVPGQLQRLKTPLPGPWRVDLLDPKGAVLFSTHLEAPNVVRAEGLQGETPALVLQPEASFLVNVPEDADAASLQVWAQAWTLSEAAPGSETWVKVGEVALPGAAP
jgi:hypothetical protein